MADVVIGDAGGDGEFDAGRVVGRGGGQGVGFAALFALQFADGFLEQLGVQVKADFMDVAALVGAEDVAGAADFEVAHSDAETGAQVGGFEDGLEAHFGGFGHPPAAAGRGGEAFASATGAGFALRQGRRGGGVFAGVFVGG